jgi:hypothetical protein
MQIVHTNDMPLREKVDGQGGRAGSFKARRVLRGDPTSLGNFSLTIFYQDGSFYSPRHHHNFDQFRFQIEGDADFHRDGMMTPGTLGYFPEGAYYGPTSGPAHTVAVLQFGGPSGCGYLGSTAGAAEELKKIGKFKNGVFRRNPGVAGKRNQDSYEAIWEHVRQRPLVYPKPQYAAAIMMDTDRFPWLPVEGWDGVEEKVLGEFTNCKIRGSRYKLRQGAKFNAGGRGVYLVLSGRGRVEDEVLQTHTAVYVDDGETARFVADEVIEIVLMGLPSIDLIARASKNDHSMLLAAE